MKETSAAPREKTQLNALGDKPMVNNLVLIKIDVIPDDGHKLESGIITAGSKWDDASHLARHGTVIRVPKRLVTRGQSTHETAMMWKTIIEIKEGDTVFFGKMASANAPELQVNGDRYYLMPYYELIARVRNKKIYPLNGYCLVEPVMDKLRIEGLKLDFNDKQNKRMGKVKYVGRRNDGYFATQAIDADVSPGDIVLFEGNFYTELEQDIYASWGEKIGFVQRCWISAIISKND